MESDFRVMHFQTISELIAGDSRDLKALKLKPDFFNSNHESSPTHRFLQGWNHLLHLKMYLIKYNITNIKKTLSSSDDKFNPVTNLKVCDCSDVSVSPLS